MSTDVYTIITQRIIAQLESGGAPWRKMWRGGDTPRNLMSNKPYRGVNLLLLGSTAFTSPYWLTFNQVQQFGGRVRKGAQSEPVIFWKIFNDAQGENGDGSNKGRTSRSPTRAARNGSPSKRPPMLRYYRVFNVEQTEGLEKHIPEQNAEQAPFAPLESAARIIEGMPQCPPIRHDEPRAFYAPLRDFVNMPQPEAFNSAQDYYAVAFHELTHATGHETRLNRAGVAGNALAPFGSADYSREELVAELGSAFVCAEAGINNTLDNSAAYLQGWLGVLKADSRLIVTAASAAQRAADFILNRHTSPDTEDGAQA